MAVKIDLEKAYDRLDWGFIDDMLEDIGIPNDLILLNEAFVNRMSIMKRVFENFCVSFGHRFNVQKTHIFFFKNVPHELKENISCGLGFSYVDYLEKYLGVPLLHQRVTKDTYQYIMGNIKKKLARWKAKLLSLVDCCKRNEPPLLGVFQKFYQLRVTKQMVGIGFAHFSVRSDFHLIIQNSISNLHWKKIAKLIFLPKSHTSSNLKSAIGIKAILSASQSNKRTSAASPRKLIIKKDHKWLRASEDASAVGKTKPPSTKWCKLKTGLLSSKVPSLPAAPIVFKQQILLLQSWALPKRKFLQGLRYKIRL
ncbi:hypothetical protein J1N35_019088 [Gossypium stocksii]|uniref:Reverse transcriptase domain-containing protein n=1 Tax=Gossypium stocksii TaxID=47602 RepID=A0A9D3VQ32_9ROSI|nr:hypothetical protein J1N35_019088 [Gossypium stocksii]